MTIRNANDKRYIKEIVMNTENEKYAQAKERVKALKEFYSHIGIYILINLMLFAINMLVTPSVIWFIWPLMGWGVAVCIHGLTVFASSRGFLGQDWEERKIREYMKD